MLSSSCRSTHSALSGLSSTSGGSHVEAIAMPSRISRSAHSGLFECDLQDPIVKAFLEGFLLDRAGQEDFLGVLAFLARSIKAEDVTSQFNGETFLTHSRQLCDQADVALLIEQINDRLPDFFYDGALGRLFDVAEGFEDRLASVQRPDRNAKNAIELLATGTPRSKGLFFPDLLTVFSEFA